MGKAIPREISSRISGLWAWLVCPTVFLFSYVPVLNLYARGILFVFLLWFFYTAISIKKRIQYQAPLLAFLLWGVFSILISLVLSDDMETAIEKWVTVLTTGLLGLAVFNSILWNNSVLAWSWAFIVSALLAYASSYLPIANYVVSEYETEVGGRVVGTLANANTFGRSMTQAFLIGLGLLLVYKSRGGRSSLVLVAMGLLALGVLESNSRTAMLGLLAAVLALFHCISWRFLFSPLRMAMFSGVAGAMTAVFMAFPERFTAALDRMLILTAFFGLTSRVETKEQSVDERADLANTALETFSNNPYGIGLDNFRLIAGKYAHSNYLEVLVSTGLAGLIIYYAGLLWMGGAILKKTGRGKNPEINRYVIWVFLSIAILDVSNVSYYSKVYWVFLGLICGIYVLATRKESLVASR